MTAVETRVKALEDAPGGGGQGGGGLKVGDTGWKDIETGQVGAGQYQYRVVGATMFLRKAGDEWRALPKPTKTVTHVATLPQTYGKLERASTQVVKKGDPALGKQDEWTSDGSMVEIWPNWTVKYTCMDLQGIYSMGLLKTAVEKPLISPAGAGGGITEEMLNQKLDTLKTSLETQIRANSAELAHIKTQVRSTKTEVETLETKVTALENKPGSGTPLLVLGPTEAVPAGTKPGTVIVRRSN